jgi:hypothetical protein
VSLRESFFKEFSPKGTYPVSALSGLRRECPNYCPKAKQGVFKVKVSLREFQRFTTEPTESTEKNKDSL